MMQLSWNRAEPGQTYRNAGQVENKCWKRKFSIRLENIMPALNNGCFMEELKLPSCISPVHGTTSWVQSSAPQHARSIWVTVTLSTMCSVIIWYYFFLFTFVCLSAPACVRYVRERDTARAGPAHLPPFEGARFPVSGRWAPEAHPAGQQCV